MVLAVEKERAMRNRQKLPPVIEDLRQHTPTQLAELRLLVNAGIEGRPDPRRPGFYELDGVAHVYYVFQYPTGHKILLLAAWQREIDPVAEMVACCCPAA
jgi:hypothetical protein